MIAPIDLDSYFARIGYVGPREPVLETLRGLHALHPAAIAFENLDPLLGRRVHLDTASVQRKLIHNSRGGYCFEQNGLFAAVLKQLGFNCTTLAARVLYGRTSGSTRRSHMLLKLDTPQGIHLADVGFGGQTPSAPLRLDSLADQRTPHGLFRVTRDGDQFVTAAQMDGEWRALYRFSLEEQSPEDHEMANWYVSTHPGSEFRARLYVARHPPGRRLTLLGDQFTIRNVDGESSTRTLSNSDEIARVLEQEFLIRLPEPRHELLAAISRATQNDCNSRRGA